MSEAISIKELGDQVGLNAATTDLVERFSRALIVKLRHAEQKHGYSDHWQHADPHLLRRDLMIHLAKGDPKDVAAYCMFLWFLGAETVG